MVWTDEFKNEVERAIMELERTRLEVSELTEAGPVVRDGMRKV